MKKVLFLASLAAMAMTSCTSESNEYVGDNTPKEIAFMPLAQRPTRTAAYFPVSGTGFPENYAMQVSANIDASSAYFHDVTFAKDATTWKGTPAQHWPLSSSTLNFLAVTKWPSSYSKDIVTTTFTNSSADGATVVLGDNKPSEVDGHAGSQHDLMYAVGRGIVVKNGNSITYSGNNAGDASAVDMVFKHALAWVTFTAVSNVSGFTLNSITLNDAYYGGTYTLDNSGNKNYIYDGSTYNSRTATPITGTWTSPTNQANVAVPGWSANTIAVSPSAATQIGNGLIVVPTNGIGETKSFTSFTIAYTYQGKSSTYTYNTATVLEQAKKYTYAITFALNEIEINPSVTDWTSVDATPVPAN